MELPSITTIPMHLLLWVDARRPSLWEGEVQEDSHEQGVRLRVVLDGLLMSNRKEGDYRRWVRGRVQDARIQCDCTK